MKVLVNCLAPAPGGSAPVAPAASVPSFTPFEPTSELWKDYRARFDAFIGANAISQGQTAQVFLTNQSTTTYKLLCTLAEQQPPPKDVNSHAGHRQVHGKPIRPQMIYRAGTIQILV